MSRYKKILLTGGSGALGRAILQSGLFSDLLYPSHDEMDITKREEVARFFERHAPDAVVHSAAIANMARCEESPAEAIRANILGTSHLVEAARASRFIYISTDGVYSGTEGNYSELDPTIPYNTYGWTKLGGECAVRTLQNFCIIRTSFFDPENIKYQFYATDKYSSRLPIHYLPRAIAFLLNHDFTGVVNVGGERRSDYEIYKSARRAVEPCLFEDIVKKSGGSIAGDSSMNIALWNGLITGTKDLHI